MNYHRNLSTRVKKAKATKVTAMGNDYVKINGSKNSYTVTVKRVGNALLTECSPDDSLDYCRGNHLGTVCYHSIRAVLELAKAKNYEVAFCVSQNHAEILSRIGGKVYKIQSRHGEQGKLWMVAIERAKTWRHIQLDQIEETIKHQEAKLETNPWSIKAQKALNGLVQTREAIKAELA